MVSDAPEFLDALVTLNDEILDEAARTGQITPTELATRQNAMLEAKQLVPSDYESRHQRLRLSLGLGREVLDDDDEPEDEVGAYNVAVAVAVQRCSPGGEMAGVALLEVGGGDVVVGGDDAV